ncbi:MAG: SMC-Scp complex subunit ScpB [Bacteroidota bacterium]|jgi:segregation and condensation protein B
MQEQTTIEKAELKIPTTLKALVEALIFAAQEPLSINQIRAIYQGDDARNNGSKQIEPETIRQSVTDLNLEYEKSGRPYRIVQIAGGYQFATLSDYAEWLGKLYKEQGRRKLSQSGVETLAIVAYKQPVTKAEIEKIRGVNCDYVLKTLLEKELLTVTGRAESVGRPLLYGTTKEFLKHFGLNDITDLPRPREIEEILGESQFETERRMLEAQEGGELMKKEQEDFKSRLPHIPKKKSDLEEKDVEIIQSKKTRDIRIVPVVDRKLLEEAGQETIVFNLEDVPPVEQLPSPSVTEEKPKVESPFISSKVNIHEEVDEQEYSVQVPDESVVEPVAEISQGKLELDVLAKQAIEADRIKAKTENSVGLTEVNAPEEENIQQPKRWKVWKEKIQGFIKKLFA